MQEAAGIHLPCGNHRHITACHNYGFHDLRCGFATATGRKLGNRGLAADDAAQVSRDHRNVHPDAALGPRT